LLIRSADQAHHNSQTWRAYQDHESIRAVIDDSSQAPDVYSSSNTMKLVALLRLTRYTSACFLAYLVSRAHNRTETGVPDGRPGRLHRHAAVQHPQPVGRRGSH
ncbi:MAG TPA: hypothetical protein VJQ54_05655, partial [Candidatus Sulfotelmatobacter sp.]|nr:hypothetical protein [Candidatus Sulfotelmatobacter sp.]